MSVIMAAIALAMACAWAGARLAWSGRSEAERLGRENAALTAQAEQERRERARLIQALEIARRELADAETGREGFLARLCHEMRTPLNAVIGFSDALEGMGPDPLSPKQARAVRHIRDAGDRLILLADRILDLADAGDCADAEPRRLDPVLATRKACAALGVDADLARVTLEPPAPASGAGVAADPARLDRLLRRLIGSAIRHNRPGGVVRVAVRSGPDHVLVEVSDDGRGAAPARTAELFQPLAADGGVGLAVARRLAAAMGGRLDGAAGPGGRGLLFTLALPLAGGDAVPATGLGPAVVLYVEDHPANAALMRQVLPALGPLSLHLATTGAEGLAHARDLRPDVVILDIGLPDMDGFEIIAHLKADPLTRHLPVIALTANAMPETARRGREAGFAAWLTKPLDVGALATALNKALEGRAGARDRPSAA